MNFFYNLQIRMNGLHARVSTAGKNSDACALRTATSLRILVRSRYGRIHRVPQPLQNPRDHFSGELQYRDRAANHLVFRVSWWQPWSKMHFIRGFMEVFRLQRSARSFMASNYLRVRRRNNALHSP